MFLSKRIIQQIETFQFYFLFVYLSVPWNVGLLWVCIYGSHELCSPFICWISICSRLETIGLLALFFSLTRQPLILHYCSYVFGFRRSIFRHLTFFHTEFLTEHSPKQKRQIEIWRARDEFEPLQYIFHVLTLLRESVFVSNCWFEIRVLLIRNYFKQMEDKKCSDSKPFQLIKINSQRIWKMADSASILFTSYVDSYENIEISKRQKQINKKVMESK